MEDILSNNVSFGYVNSCESQISYLRSPGSCCNRLKENAVCADLIDLSTEGDYPWIKNQIARSSFISLLTSVYGLLITIFALVLEISQKFANEDSWLAETLFYAFMYGTGTIFFLYCYIFILYPGWFDCIQRILHKFKILSKQQKWSIKKTSHANKDTGSLYLRLGALFFGTVGIVLYALEIFLCITHYNCRSYEIVKMTFGGVFAFIQMHFIFCNSQISIVEFQSCAKLGLMHLVSVNLWTWFRFVIAKQAVKTCNSPCDPSDYLTLLDDDANLTLIANTIRPGRLFSILYFGDIASFLTTCIVEYSVIGAAIMFTLWRTTDGIIKRSFVRVKRKYKMRIDCSSSSTGLFGGILYLIGAFVSIGVYSFFKRFHNLENAQMVFGLADVTLFSLTLIASLYGIYRTRLLQYCLNEHSSGEMLDNLLLVIGLSGELIYCCTGIVYWISRKDDPDGGLRVYILSIYLCRLLQVVIQAVFILMGTQLRALAPKIVDLKPGKQIVTFLLIANVTLFFFHTFENMKATFGYSNKPHTASYTILIYTAAPLIVFYRFHSSVCLAEVWKHCYSPPKRLNVHPPTTSFSEISLY